MVGVVVVAGAAVVVVTGFTVVGVERRVVVVVSVTSVVEVVDDATVPSQQLDPVGISIVWAECTSRTRKTSKVLRDGVTSTVRLAENPVQGVPRYSGSATSSGPSSGLPLEHRTRGTPWVSTSTAVPV